MSTFSRTGEQRVILRSISWNTYESLVRESHGSGRISYDRGDLEIMSPGMPHELAKRLLGRMIETYTLKNGIAIRSSSSTTFKREEIKRGFEADESYYIRRECEVREIGEIDLSIHPPPDLVIEVDITNSSLPKQSLFAAMDVPEFWRFDGDALTIHVLDQGNYEVSSTSSQLPDFPISLAERILRQQNADSETALIQRFLSRLN